MNKPWPMVPLGEVVIPVERTEAPIPGVEYRQIGVRLWGEGAYERETIDGGQTKYKAFSRVERDDIIVNKIWARNGSVAVVSEQLDGCFASGEFPIFAPIREKLDSKWVHWLTKTRSFWEKCDEKSRGTSGKNRIRPEKFLEIEVPLPPLSEQKRLVARIEELASKVEEARGLRREAVEEAESFIISSLLHFPLQPHWEKRRISDCSVMSTGTTPPSARIDYFGGPLQWYTPGDLNNQRELGRSSRTLSEKAVQDGKARLFSADTILLVAIGGSLGKVALTHERCSANQQITGIKFNEAIQPEFGFWWMRRLSKDMMAAAPQATLPIINQSRIGQFEIVMPPISEQRRIVAYLDGLQAKVDALKRLQVETSAELYAMLPSVLDKAFKGDLS